MKIYNLVLIPLFLLSCGPRQKEKKVNVGIASDGTASKKELPTQEYGYLKAVGDSLEIPSFGITVVLSEQAKKKLTEFSEKVLVVAYFEGTSKDSIPKEYRDYLDADHLQLCDTTMKLSASGGTVVFDKMKFPKGMYDALQDKDITVLINIWSERRSYPDNMLDAGILSKRMSLVKGKTFKLDAKLIGEPDKVSQ